MHTAVVRRVARGHHLARSVYEDRVLLLGVRTRRGGLSQDSQGTVDSGQWTDPGRQRARCSGGEVWAAGASGALGVMGAGSVDDRQEGTAWMQQQNARPSGGRRSAQMGRAGSQTRTAAVLGTDGAGAVWGRASWSCRIRCRQRRGNKPKDTGAAAMGAGGVVGERTSMRQCIRRAQRVRGRGLLPDAGVRWWWCRGDLHRTRHTCTARGLVVAALICRAPDALSCANAMTSLQGSVGLVGL
jgi:hypothetical protein